MSGKRRGQGGSLQLPCIVAEEIVLKKLRSGVTAEEVSAAYRFLKSQEHCRSDKPGGIRLLVGFFAALLSVIGYLLRFWLLNGP